MSKKISLDDLNSILSSQEVQPEKARKILAEAQKLLEEEAAEKEENKGKKNKYQFIVVASEEMMETPLKDCTLWISKIPADANHEKVHATIREAAVTKNLTKKGRKHPVKTLADSFSTLKPKDFANTDISREDLFFKGEYKQQTKEAVIVVGVPFNILAE